MFIANTKSLEEGQDYPVVFDISAGSRSEGAHLIPWLFNNNNNQRFEYGDDGVIYTFTGMVLTVDEAIEGAYVVQSIKTLPGNNFQLWDLLNGGIIQLRDTKLVLGLRNRTIALCDPESQEYSIHWRTFEFWEEIQPNRVLFNICPKGCENLCLEFRDSATLGLANRDGSEGQKFSYNEKKGTILSPFIKRVIDVRGTIREGAEVIHNSVQIASTSQSWRINKENGVIQNGESDFVITVPNELQEQAKAKICINTNSPGQQWKLHPLATQKSARK